MKTETETVIRSGILTLINVEDRRPDDVAPSGTAVLKRKAKKQAVKL